MSKGDNPLVSVIVPVYNVEKYLKECIESIVGQTYKNLEIILVDDGSTDGSGKMCDQFAKKDKRVRVIHKKNEGPNRARQVGFEKSTGEYVVFVDSDDVISSKFIQYMLGAIVKYNTDFAICSYNKFDKNFDDSIDNPQIVLRDKQKVVTDFLIGANEAEFLLTVVHMRILKRELVAEVDWSRSNYRINEDEVILSYLYHHSVSENVPFVQNKLYYYRQRPESIMDEFHKEYKNSFNGRPIDRFTFLNQVLEHRRELFGGGL